MKEILFLNSEKNTLVNIPFFLKKFFIKKNFYILPTNKTLKKIIVFFYLKLLRKSRIILGLFFRAKFTMKNPKKYDYVIFDDLSLGTVNRILPKKKYFTIASRVENFKEIFITKEVIIYIIKNFFRNSLKINYLCSLIHIIKPKKIVTIIDNSFDFYLVYQEFRNKNISFHAIQNAYRNKNYLKIIFNKNNYAGSYYTFGDYEFNVIKKNYLCSPKANIKPIGSLRTELAKEYLFKKNKNFTQIYDICLISEATFQISTGGGVGLEGYIEAHKSAIKLLKYTLFFCNKFKKKLLFLGRCSKFQNTQEEELSYYKYKNENSIFNIQFFDKSKFENIENLLRSNLILGCQSTLLRESFGLKKKILVCDWVKKTKGINKIFFPSNGILKLKSEKYIDFEKRMIEILQLNFNQYLSKVINPKLIYNLDFDTLKFLRKEMVLQK